MFSKITQFNKEVIGLDREIGPVKDSKEFLWCKNVILEELDELTDAWTDKDFIGQIDAVIDLLYFSGGILNRMGLPPEVSRKIFDHVHECNMKKMKGVKEERETPIDLDAVKPDGWEGPEEGIAKILSEWRLLPADQK